MFIFLLFSSFRPFLSFRSLFFFITFTLTLTFSFPLSLSRLEAGTVHAIIAADTNDWDIGPGALVDFKRLRTESRRIAEATGLNLHVYPFKGDQYRAEAIVECLASLNVAADDIILYLHTSHGVRTHSMQLDPLPILEFGPHAALYLSDLTKLIEDKHPRLSVILADCCQACIPDIFEPPLLHVAIKAGAPSVRELQLEQYRRLFLLPRGTIILLGSAPGGLARVTSLYGSYCTFYWTQTLNKHSKNAEPITWKEVLEETKDMVKGITTTHIMHPTYVNKPQHIWYSIQIDTEEPFISPTPSFIPRWRTHSPIQDIRHIAQYGISTLEDEQKEINSTKNPITNPTLEVPQ